jgi:hypothetical protein
MGHTDRATTWDVGRRQGKRSRNVCTKAALPVLTHAKFGMAIQLLFIVTIGLTKVSILMTYLRIFPSKLNKRFCHIMLGYTIAFSVACFFLVLFQCTRVAPRIYSFHFLTPIVALSACTGKRINSSSR